ncbi:MAG: hypothetical protein RL518_502 [Pseudomonadota bacterium]
MLENKGMTAKGTPQQSENRAVEVPDVGSFGVRSEGFHLPSDLPPWLDQSLSTKDRLRAYRDFVLIKVEEIKATVDRLGHDPSKVLEVRDAPETRRWVSEAIWVRDVSGQDFRRRMDPLTPLGIAEEMVASYNFDEGTGTSSFKIPAGVSDIAAMHAVNHYFRVHFAYCLRDAIYAADIEWYEEDLSIRDSVNSREVSIIAVVSGTVGWDRTTQGEVLAEQRLRFADERDMALAGALHACACKGEDLFQGKTVRGSVHRAALYSDRRKGIERLSWLDLNTFRYVAASGSPMPRGVTDMLGE